MADLSLSGLASGLDTPAIISQLMAIERQGQTRMQYRQKNVQAQATGLKDVKTKLEALQDGRRRAARRLDLDGQARASSPPTPRAWASPARAGRRSAATPSA